MTATPAKPGRWKTGIVWALVVSVIAVFVLVLVGQRPRPKPPPVPAPNAYDDLVRAGRMIAGPAPNEGDLVEAEVDDLRAWVEANRDALEVARQALERPSGVPLTFEQIEPTIDDLGLLRKLGRLMMADGLVDAREGRTIEAADRFVDTIRLARQSSRNGLMIHQLQRLAIEDSYGLEGLRLIRRDLDAERCRSLTETLLALEETSVSVDRTLRLEDQWRVASTSRSMRIGQAIFPGVQSRLMAMVATAKHRFAMADQRTRVKRLLLAVSLAIRAYQREHDGALPRRLDDLTPEYLPEVPRDPFGGGHPLFYRVNRDGESFRLYSVGVDGSDDRGLSFPSEEGWARVTGDIVLDPAQEEEKQSAPRSEGQVSDP